MSTALGIRGATLALAALIASAGSAVAAQRDFRCPSGTNTGRSAEVVEALKPLFDGRARRMAAIATTDDKAEAERQADALDAAYLNERWTALSPLASSGNVEAMVRLADDLRNSDDPAEIRLWLTLSQCAAARGSAIANDELARFWWHQKGDGSLADVQANRELAMDYAGHAASAGDIGALNRISVYIAGNVHQYPAAPSLAAQVVYLCAQADAITCQRAIVSRRPYDFGQTISEDAFWLGRLAEREPQNFARQRDQVWAKLSEDELRAVRQRVADFTPLMWVQAEPRWRALTRTILAHGASSAGALSTCTTATPWCRGAGLAPPRDGKATR